MTPKHVKELLEYIFCVIYAFVRGMNEWMNDTGSNIQSDTSKSNNHKCEFICSDTFYTGINYFKNLCTT